MDLGSSFFLAVFAVLLSDIKNKVKDKELKILLFWMVLIFVFFTSSVTKLYHYILPFYVPFSPDCGILAKKTGRLATEKDITKIYYYDYHTEQNLKNTLIYYNYPINIEYLELGEVEIFDENSAVYCLKSKFNYQDSKKLNYDFYPCKIIK